MSKIENVKNSLGSAIKIGLVIIGGLLTIMILATMFRTVELGKTDVYQNTLTGSESVYHGPDWYFSPLFFGNEETYKDETTISFTKAKGDGNPMPIDIAFADTYEADLPLSVRYSLPGTDEEMLKVHKAFRSHANLVRSLYRKTTVDVAVGTSTQFTAEEVFQGGLNSLKASVEDQIKNGLYITERKRVVVSNNTKAKVPSGEDKTTAGTTEQTITVWKAVPKEGKDGHKLRMNNPFSQYGISASQLTLELPTPETLLRGLLVTKKESVAKKILSMQKQENAKEDIKTAKLEGQAKRETAEQKKLIIADAEIIERKKEVKLAGLQAQREIVDRQKLADLAVIDKTKELQIAQANEEIQKANEIAAKYEAQSKLHNGLADAEIKTAMYLAVREDILKLEVEKVTQLAKYKALGTANITLPSTVMMGGSSGSDAGGLNELTNLHIMDKLK